jgi:hypothetical protein
LKLDLILEYALTYQIVNDSLPPIREIRKMPRSYVCNVIFTCLGDKFQSWVDQRCKERNDNIAVDKDLNIQLDENVAKAFHNSNAISRMIYLFYFKLLLLFLLIFILFQSLEELVASL